MKNILFFCLSILLLASCSTSTKIYREQTVKAYDLKDHVETVVIKEYEADYKENQYVKGGLMSTQVLIFNWDGLLLRSEYINRNMHSVRTYRHTATTTQVYDPEKNEALIVYEYDENEGKRKIRSRSFFGENEYINETEQAFEKGKLVSTIYKMPDDQKAVSKITYKRGGYMHTLDLEYPGMKRISRYKYLSFDKRKNWTSQITSYIFPDNESENFSIITEREIIYFTED